MRGFLLPVSALLAVLLFALFLLRTEGERTVPELAASDRLDEATAVSSSVTAVELESDSAQAIERVPEVSEALGSEALVPIEVSPTCTVRGRVEDEFGSPISGVRCKFDSEIGPWSDPLPEDLPPYSQVTGEDGSFEFEFPLPTSHWVRLRLSPGEAHAEQLRYFGFAGGRQEERLPAGASDLGVFVLESVGTISGRAFDETGAPVEGAKVFVGLENSEISKVEDSTDASGRFRLLRVPGGSKTVEIDSQDHLRTYRGDVRVEAGSETTEIDFVLTARPTITGRVVDQEGQPVAGALIRGIPKPGSMGCGARTETDGTFTLHLPYAVALSLQVEAEGYEPLEASSFHEPGTDGLALVITRVPVTEFLVQDALTKEPVERFGLRIIQAREPSGSSRSASDHAKRASVETHSGGTIEARANPQTDDYTIVAPGYAPQRGNVHFDAPETRNQTIQLQRGGSVSGRLVLDGRGVPNPVVDYAANRQPMKNDGDLASLFSDYWGRNVDQFAGYRQSTRGDGSGRFLIEDLAPGEYQLEITAEGNGVARIARVVVMPNRTTELGEIEPIQPAEILGRVTRVGGRPLDGLTAALGELRKPGRNTRGSNEQGEFHFRGLTPGKHYLWFLKKPGVIAEGPPLVVELEAGEKKAFEVDLSDRVPCTVEILVKVNGNPAEGVHVGNGFPSGRTMSLGLGDTGNDGRVRGEVLAEPETIFSCSTPKLLPLGESEALHLIPGSHERFELNFETGRLTLQKPAQADSPTSHSLRLDLGRQGGRLTPEWAVGDGGVWRYECGELSSGDYELVLSEEGGTQKRSVVVKPGEETVVTFD